VTKSLMARTHIEETGLIPSLHPRTLDDARFAAETLADAGLPLLEIVMTAPGSVDAVADLVKRIPPLVVGADVSSLEAARRAIAEGAAFITSPGVEPRIVELALEHHVLAVPGAMTPTEVATAWEARADFVKIFPCAPLGGDAYIRALRAPFPEVRLVASGGVNQQNAASLVRAGAVALGVGTALIPVEAVHERRRDWIIELSRRFLRLVAEGRQDAAAGGPLRTC
jgi:2-dehydro-3-deoxyphosphogluconate aldolase/(4S)-4-hydroxy-2-oxoglutarate aldolase